VSDYTEILLDSTKEKKNIQFNNFSVLLRPFEWGETKNKEIVCVCVRDCACVSVLGRKK